MKFLDLLKSKIGSLVTLKSEFFNYNTLTFETEPGFVCLLVDAKSSDNNDIRVDGDVFTKTFNSVGYNKSSAFQKFPLALLLINNQLLWTRVGQLDLMFCEVNKKNF